MKSAQSVFRTALIYDRVNSWGGAEKVLLALHRLYPDAPLYTSVYEPELAPWANDWEIRTSWLQRIPWARRRHRMFGWLMPWLFAGFDLRDFDLIISVTSEAAKTVRTGPNQIHLCYLLTPTRYLWSHQAEYLEKIPASFRPLAKLVSAGLRQLDRQAAQRPSLMIPISKRVGLRARRFYQRSIERPVYPPLTGLGHERPPKYQPKRWFVFTWGRQVAYKRFDLVIRACLAARVPLVLAGSGPEADNLQKLVQLHDPRGRLIHLVGSLSDGELQWYLKRAGGAIFPQEEDFGLAIMEAQLAGCPVIVNSRAGAAELLTDQSAIFISKTSVAEVVKAIQRLRRKTWHRLDIVRQARQYAGAYFARQWRSRLKALEGNK